MQFDTVITRTWCSSKSAEPVCRSRWGAFLATLQLRARLALPPGSPSCAAATGPVLRCRCGAGNSRGAEKLKLLLQCDNKLENLQLQTIIPLNLHISSVRLYHQPYGKFQLEWHSWLRSQKIPLIFICMLWKILQTIVMLFWNIYPVNLTSQTSVSLDYCK